MRVRLSWSREHVTANAGRSKPAGVVTADLPAPPRDAGQGPAQGRGGDAIGRLTHPKRDPICMERGGEPGSLTDSEFCWQDLHGDKSVCTKLT